MGWRRSALAALILICFGLLALGGLSQSNLGRDYRSDTDYFDAKCRSDQRILGEYKKDCQHFLYRITDDPVSIFTIVLSLATLALWIATRDLVNGAERTAERQLRAYVGVEQIGFDRLSDHEITRVSVRIRNFGQTPAFNFSTHLYLHSYQQPYDTEPEIEGEAPHDRGGAVMPGDNIVTMCELDRRFIPDFVSSIGNESTTIFLLGYIYYVDAFEKSHTISVKMKATGSRAFSSSPFMFCDEGNNHT